MVEESFVLKAIASRIIVVTIVIVLTLPHSQTEVGEGQSVKAAKQLA